MADEQNKCTALVPYESKGLEKRESFIERKQRELREAIERGQVHEPITTALSIAVIGKALLGGAIATGLSFGANLLIGAATRQKPQTSFQGRQSGRVGISSQLGQKVQEFFFGDPGDGLGGTLVPAIVICLDPTRPIDFQDTVSRQPVGGGKGFGGQQTQEVNTREYFFPILVLMYGQGPGRVKKLFAHADVLFDMDAGVSTYQGESASSYTAPYQIVDYDAASGGKEVTLQANGTVNGGAVQWDNVQSNGAADRQLRIRFRTGLGLTMSPELTVNGVAQIIALPTSNETFQWYTLSVSLNDGLNTIKIQNKSPLYNLGIDQIYLYPGPPTGGSTGILDPTVPTDPSYNPITPLDPTVPYNIPAMRWAGEPSVDSYGAQSGTLLFGGNAQFVIYEGNDTQLPDPTMEAAIDGFYGEGSTPAYRNKLYEVDTRFFLTRWSGLLPNRTALVEHVTIRTLAQFCAFQSSRVGVTAYDFTAFNSIKPRGYRKLGQRYQAKEPMEEAGELFDVFFTEIDGVLTGLNKYPASVATLYEEDFGWIEGDEFPEGPISLIDPVEPNEIDQPQRMDVRHLDLDKEGEVGLQTYGRQIVEGKNAETLDYSDWTLTRDEAQAEAQKELYRRYVEQPGRPFTLSYKFLWLHAGNVITADLSASTGFIYEIFIEKISGGIGVLECEWRLIDTPVFTQPASTNPHGYERPVVPVQAMTICAFLDLPVRDVDATFNNGSLFYAACRPMTNTNLTWAGASLYQKKGELGWEEVARFTKPATMGKIVSAKYIQSTTTLFDNDGEFLIDIYGNDTLESLSEEDVLTGGNPAAFGNMVGQYKDAVRVEDGSPNRWRVTGILHGRQGTDNELWQDFTGKVFVVLNEAVKPVAINLSDINAEKEYKAVTVGQSLDDAATIKYTHTGRSLRHHPPAHLEGENDSESDLWARWTRIVRVGNTLRDNLPAPIVDEREVYKFQIKTLTGETTLPNGKERIMAVSPPFTQAAVMESDASLSDKYSGVTHNSISISGAIAHARSLQDVTEAQNFIEGTLELEGMNGEFEAQVGVGLIPTDWPWKGGPDDLPLFVTLSFDTFSPGSDGLKIYEYGVLKVSLPYSASSRIRFVFSGTEIRAHLNYQGIGSRADYIFNKEIPFPLHALATVHVDGSENTGGVSAITMTTWPHPSTIYSRAQKLEDFGSVPDETRVAVWQEDAYGGPGEVTEAILPTKRQIITRPVYASFYAVDSRTALPELDTGEEWEVLTGTIGTRRYMAYASAVNGSGFAAAVIDKGVSDCKVGVMLREVATNNGHGLTLRATDANNRYILDVFPTNTIRLFNMVGGVAGAAVRTWTRTISERDLIEAEWKGDVLTVIHNGEKLSPTYTNATRNTATKFGLHFGSTLVGLKHFTENQEPVATEYVRVSSPQNFQGFQRNQYNRANIPVVGTTNAADGSVMKGRFNGGPAETIGTVASGAFSGTLSSQYMGQGNLEVWIENNPDAITIVRYVIVGDGILGTGQSNQRGGVASPQFYAHPTLRAALFDPNNAIHREASDPTSGATPGANINSLWPILLGNLMSDGVPRFYLNTGIGATGLTNGEWEQGGGAYNNALAKVTASGYNGFSSMIFYQGEKDAVNAGMTQSLYETSLKQMRSDMSGDLGFGELVMNLVQIGHIDFPGSTATRSSIDAVRLAQSHAADTDQYIKLGACTYDLDITYSSHSIDTVWAANTVYTVGQTRRPFRNGSPHWFEVTVAGTSAAATASEPYWTPLNEGDTIVDNGVTWITRGYAGDGQHINRPDHAAIIAARLDRSIKTGDRGPRFLSATRISATQLDVELVLADGYALEAAPIAHQGFRLTTAAGASERFATAAARQSDTVIRLTFSSVATGELLSYASYNDGTNAGVYDNHATVPLPAEPFVNQIVN